MQDAACEESDPLAPQGTECRRVGTGDTLAIRWRNMQIAVAEVSQSPTLGYGTDSYRFEHWSLVRLPGVHQQPHGRRAVRVGRDWRGGPRRVRGLCAADRLALSSVGLPGGDLVAMVVGYQFTDAIRFESNWILMGVVLGSLGSPALAGSRDQAETA